MSDSTVGIIILNYNGAEDTLNCIRSVEQFNTSPVKFIVVDNCSTKAGQVDFLHEQLETMYGDKYRKEEERSAYTSSVLPYVTFVTSKTNDGYARGNNKGIRLAQSDETITHLMILNSDVLFVQDIIPSLLDGLSTLPDVGIVSPLLYKKDMDGYDFTCARKKHSNWDVILSYLLLKSSFLGVLKRRNKSIRILEQEPQKLSDPYVDIDLPSGSCMLFSKELLTKVTIFDPHTFLYYEENIIYKQEEKVGIRNYLIPSLKCIHLGATSTKRSSKSFVLKAGLDSAAYYLEEYGEMTVLQRIAFYVAKTVYGFKIKLIKTIRE